MVPWQKTSLLVVAALLLTGCAAGARPTPQAPQDPAPPPTATAPVSHTDPTPTVPAPTHPAAPATEPAFPPVPPGIATVQLQLQPGADGFGPAAADLPPGTPTVALPLYPKAVAAQETDLHPGLMRQSPYAKVGVAAYRVPVAPEPAMPWYRQQMTALGYKEVGHSTGMHLNTVTSWGISFQADSDKHLYVDLTFRPDESGQTLLVYGATFIATPARPAASILPQTITQVEVQYQPGTNGTGQPAPATLLTVTDAQTIGGLVTAVNSLQRDTRGMHGCLADFGQGADLRFVGEGGAAWQVHVHAACSGVTVNGTVLWDQGSEVWNAVRAAVGQ